MNKKLHKKGLTTLTRTQILITNNIYQKTSNKIQSPKEKI